LSGAYQLVRGPRFDVALRAGLKLPTGDSDELQGSGGHDINMGIALSDDASLQDYKASYFVSAGVLWAEEGDVLPELRRKVAFYGSIGLSKHVFEHWQFKLQLDGHSELYDSGLTELGGSVQLSMGGAVALSKRWLLDFAVVEDVVVDSASDVNFHLNLRNNF
jgi:hypothetical protein